jgi:hypothetical protein
LNFIFNDLVKWFPYLCPGSGGCIAAVNRHLGRIDLMRHPMSGKNKFPVRVVRSDNLIQVRIDAHLSNPTGLPWGRRQAGGCAAISRLVTAHTGNHDV